MSTDTLRHQLLYEVHDPARYLSPDVVADFTSAHFEDLPDDRVRITGVRGTPATDTYKLLLVARTRAGRARRASRSRGPTRTRRRRRPPRSFAKRVEMAGLEVDEWHVEYWGVDALGGPTVPHDRRASRRSACCASRGAATTSARAGLVGRELVPLTLSAPPAGLTGAGRGGGGRDRAARRSGRRSIDKALVDAAGARHDRGGAVMARLALRELCGYRAGDKGDIANVAIFADDDETYARHRRARSPPSA